MRTSLCPQGLRPQLRCPASLVRRVLRKGFCSIASLQVQPLRPNYTWNKTRANAKNGRTARHCSDALRVRHRCFVMNKNENALIGSCSRFAFLFWQLTLILFSFLLVSSFSSFSSLLSPFLSARLQSGGLLFSITTQKKKKPTKQAKRKQNNERNHKRANRKKTQSNYPTT
jgi:hypothetical protein